MGCVVKLTESECNCVCVCVCVCQCVCVCVFMCVTGQKIKNDDCNENLLAKSTIRRGSVKSSFLENHAADLASVAFERVKLLAGKRVGGDNVR